MEPRFCSFCGAPLPATAKFCPRCGRTIPALMDTTPFEDTDPYGTQVIQAPDVPPVNEPEPVAPPVIEPPVAPAPRVATPAPVQPKRGNTLLVTLAIVAAVLLLGFILLLKLPFGSEGTLERKQVESDTIGEGSAPNTKAPLGVDEATAPPPAATIAPAADTAATATTPPLVTPEPAPAERVSVEEAMSIVRGAAHSYYDGVTADCMSVRSEGFVNDGYTLTVSDTCNNTTLGSWRVDAKTKEVFRQQADGRYLRP